MPRRNTKRNKGGGVPIPTKEDPTDYVTLCKKITKKIEKSLLHPKGKIVNIPDQDFGDFYCEKIHKKNFNYKFYDRDLNYKFYDRDYAIDAEIEHTKNRELEENQKRREQRSASPTSSITSEEINYPDPETYTIQGNITNPPSMQSSSLFGKKTIDPSILKFSVPLTKFFEIHDSTKNIKVHRGARQSKLIIKSGFMETTLIFNFVYKDNKDNMYNVNLLEMYNEYKDPAFNKTYSSFLPFTSSSMTLQELNQGSSLYIRSSNPNLVLNFEIEFYIDKRDKKDDHRVLIIKNIRLNGQSLPVSRFQGSDGRWHENVVVSNLDTFTNNINEIKPVLQLAGKLRKRTKRNHKKNKRNHKKSKRSNLK